MYCKKGDLAITLGVHPDYSGKFVRVLHRARNGNLLPNGNEIILLNKGGPSWVIEFSHEIPVELFLNGTPKIVFTKHAFAPDSRLRPIRYSDGQDETLSWADIPKKVTA